MFRYQLFRFTTTGYWCCTPRRISLTAIWLGFLSLKQLKRAREFSLKESQGRKCRGVEKEEPEPLIVNEVSVESEALVPSEDAPIAISKSQHQQIGPVTPNAAVTESTNSNSIKDGGNQVGEGGGFSICIRDLPRNVTNAMIAEALKKFGPIKIDGIQILQNNKAYGSFAYGFVEFEVPEAVQNAIEAESIVIGGRKVSIQKKKSTDTRGTASRGWSPKARGGIRSYERGRGCGRGGFPTMK